MKMVLEEIEGDLARFIPDEGASFHVKKSLLPEKYQIGEVYEVTISEGQVSMIEPLKEETQERLAKMRQKRKKLLNKRKK
ncbi:DUF3006 family protein [Carnobacterium inhibens]|uniref:DUF3006 domain-containing protein n=2 Tax=Carnobacterium inhibens TaxID=147709 RepID=U5SBY3_9LACT|nr:DUF3006 family protein [Carnobacterium inhibens]AGY81347.1 hypothetical protein Q783_03400 [Carnobacterium inhibens subsp. gilichinskyi]MBC9825145.1 DUF3006 family protein [Carnobacterium inhibens]